jgi:hypothetical protein
MAQEQRILFTSADIGNFKAILEHACKCGSCCRRVAVWSETPHITSANEWILKAIAKISFGCQKWCNGAIVEVDVKQGVILDLMADYIEVSIGPVEIVEGLEGDAPPEIVFGAMSACCGAGAARGCATRTLPSTLLAGTAITLFKIPPFAYAVSFASPQATSLFASTVVFYQLGSGTSSVITSSTGDTVPDPWMLVGGATHIGIDPNIVGEGTIAVEPVFLIGV